MHKFLTHIYILSLMGLCLGRACAGSAPHYSPQSPKSIDVVLGKENALTVVEYGSLSCGACAHFAKEILPTIEKEYVQTGKIRLVIRPMVMNETDVKASMLACCAQNPHKLQLAYWHKQNDWASKEDDQALRKIAKDNGMTDNQIEDCLADKQLRQTLYTKKFIALKKNITGIPTVFINDKLCDITHDVAGFRKAIDQALEEANRKN